MCGTVSSVLIFCWLISLVRWYTIVHKSKNKKKKVRKCRIR